MSTNIDVGKMKEKLARLNERSKSAEEELKKIGGKTQGNSKFYCRGGKEKTYT